MYTTVPIARKCSKLNSQIPLHIERHGAKSESYEINVISIFSPPASLKKTSEQDREHPAINGIDLEQRAEMKVHFHLSSLLQIKPSPNRAAPNAEAPFIPSDV
jgi:hypothetical protein